VLGAAALLATSLIACSDSNDEDDAPTATAVVAEGLAEKFITLLQAKDVTRLTDFFDDSFIIQRYSGEFLTKDEYLAALPDINEFSISNVVFKQTGNAVVVRWDLAVNETIGGQLYRGSPAPRLSTFVHVDNDWRMMSHANFNVPEEADN